MNNRKSKMSTFSTPLKRAGALSATAALLGACTILGGGAAASASSTTTIRIAIVSKPSDGRHRTADPSFEKEYPNIKVVYDTLPEDTERALIETDIATQANEFNAVMISNYETPIWAKDGWLVNLSQKFANKTLPTMWATSSSRSPRRSLTTVRSTRCRSTASRRSSCTARACWPPPV